MNHDRTRGGEARGFSAPRGPGSTWKVRGRGGGAAASSIFAPGSRPAAATALLFASITLLLLSGLSPASALSNRTAQVPRTTVGPGIALEGNLSVHIEADRTNGTAPLGVNFTAITSAGGPSTFNWSFGDASDGSGNPVDHVFRTAGNFTVGVFVVNRTGDSGMAFIGIQAGSAGGPLQLSPIGIGDPSPVAGEQDTFWANASGGTAPYSVHWQFGDGGNGSGSPDSHFYSQPGNYTVGATLRDSAGHELQGEYALEVRTPNPSPRNGSLVLSLLPTPSEGNAPLDERIIATAQGGASPYSITICLGFGPEDGCNRYSADWNGSALDIATVYETAGAYTLWGEVTDALGNSTTVSTEITVQGVSSPLGVTAVDVATRGALPLVVTFWSNVSGGVPPYSIQWSFGDGAEGSSLPGESVSHTYTSVGTYRPSVSVADAGGHLEVSAPAVVTVTASTTTTPVHGNPELSPFGISWDSAGELVLAAGVGALLAVLLPAFWRRRGRRLQRDGERLVQELRRAPGNG